jgi:hypothetical protein
MTATLIGYVALPNFRRPNIGHLGSLWPHKLMTVVDRPPQCHNPSFHRGRTAKNLKPSYKRPRCVVLGQVGAGSRGVASYFQGFLVEK